MKIGKAVDNASNRTEQTKAAIPPLAYKEIYQNLCEDKINYILLCKSLA